MFKLFTRTPRITEQEKEEAASVAWDIALNSAEKAFEGKSDDLSDIFFGLLNDTAVSVAKAI